MEMSRSISSLFCSWVFTVARIRCNRTAGHRTDQSVWVLLMYQTVLCSGGTRGSWWRSHLHSHDETWGDVFHLVHHSVRSSAQFTDLLQVVRLHLTFLLRTQRDDHMRFLLMLSFLVQTWTDVPHERQLLMIQTWGQLQTNQHLCSGKFLPFDEF